MTDPRTLLPVANPDATDIRPRVSVRQNNIGLWVFGGLSALLALLLFNALEARRSRLAAPATQRTATRVVTASPSVPELYVPEYYDVAPRALVRPQPQPYTMRAPVPYRPRPVSVVRVVPPTPTPQPRPVVNTATPPSPRPPVTPTIEPRPAPPYMVPAPFPNRAIGPGQGQPRVEAARFQNPATTIPQGALINAVLETALDSTRGGQTRALVTRDVRGFDGSQILLPRGSRLIGEYRADVAPGQKRALVQWTRIIRPDGVTMALDSPAADTLGRAGVKGKVNSHFFERLTSAVLSSAVNIGQSVATRGIIGDSPVVVSVPSGGQDVAQIVTNNMSFRPTLSVKQGTRVTVFVARDLDFSSVENP